jgi:hypothetical protein
MAQLMYYSVPSGTESITKGNRMISAGLILSHIFLLMQQVIPSPPEVVDGLHDGSCASPVMDIPDVELVERLGGGLGIDRLWRVCFVRKCAVSVVLECKLLLYTKTIVIHPATVVG